MVYKLKPRSINATWRFVYFELNSILREHTQIEENKTDKIARCLFKTKKALLVIFHMFIFRWLLLQKNYQYILIVS